MMQAVLPELIIDFDGVMASALLDTKKATNGSAAKVSSQAHKQEVLSCLSGQATGGEPKAVAKKVINALYKKAGVGQLSAMLAAYSC
jgi:hypothetical protein